MRILGLSAYYHDSAAALLQDGILVAAAQEERFTRKRHDAAFPSQSILYCLKQGNISLRDVEAVVFYEKPFAKFERLLETYLAYAPKGVTSFVSAMPSWLKEKLYLKSVLRRELAALTGTPLKTIPKILFTEHHQSHAASAFYPSPYDRAGVLCLDGVGEWATTTAWLGDGSQLTPQWQINFPHSIGLLYTAFTYYTGFKVNSGEYKLMGLAPYGEPKYVDTILSHLIDLKPDGTFRLNMEYFNYATGLTMTNGKFDGLFGGPPRRPESKVTQREMDIAASIQSVTDEVVLRLGRTLHKELGTDSLCMAGGVALNCVANGKLLREGPFKEIWIQPAAGDSGGAVGAAFTAWHEFYQKPRAPAPSGGSGLRRDAMQGAYLGPEFSAEEIQRTLDSVGARYDLLEMEDLLSRVAELLDGGNVVGWFQGRMEFGPRALGNRSILGDPRNPQMQTTMNLKIKHRESFRPFAPSVTREKAGEYFELGQESPYMLLVAPLKPDYRLKLPPEQDQAFGIEKLNTVRSRLPAITHVDYSARVQTVTPDTNPRYHGLLRKFEERTGCAVLINTSFNVRGEPIVCTPEDAYRCFMRTEIDYLVLDRFLLSKKQQPEQPEDKSWQQRFELD